jgi:hypothetical protein
MLFIRRQIGPVLVAATLTVVAAVRSARGQDTELTQDQAPAIEHREVVAKLRFEAVTRKPSVGLERLRNRFESELKSRVEKLDRHVGLSADQKKKLDLAARVDILRICDRLEELEQQLELPRVHRDHAALSKALQDIDELRLRPRPEVLGERSLFLKVLDNTLTREQKAAARRIEREAAIRRYAATVEWILGTWKEMLSLSADQRERLQALLRDRTRPPRKHGERDYYGVLVQLSRVPENELKTIFSDDQWAKLSRHFEEAKRLEATLEREGYLPEMLATAASRQPSGRLASPER